MNLWRGAASSVTPVLRGWSLRWRHQLRLRLHLLRLLPATSRSLTALSIALVAIGGFLPTMFILVNGGIVGRLDGIAESGDVSGALIALILLSVATFWLQHIVATFRLAYATRLGRMLDLRLRLRVMRATSSSTLLGHLDDPAFQDKLEAAREFSPTSYKPGDSLFALTNLASLRLQGLFFAVVIARFSLILAIVLVVTSLFTRQILRSHFLETTKLLREGTPVMRRAHYFRRLALGPEAAKEIRVFGLQDWLGARFVASWLAVMTTVWSERKERRASSILLALLGAGVTAVALTQAAGAALGGDIQLGQLTVLIGAIMNVGNVGTVTTDDYILEHGLGGFPSIGELEHEVELIGRSVNGSVSAVDKPRLEIRFEDVRFTYPRQATPVLDGVNIVIPAGRSLAIVGENGAGKSTLLKLLAGFHRPTSGLVSVDGTDLADLDGPSWQRRLAPVFQDFVRYPLTARENVGFGAVSRLDDEHFLEHAADRARAGPLISGLPAGWATVLARQYQGGVELSGGEWQRIALARALAAVENGAGVVILDEPTAHLDPLTEVELYEELLRATRGLTTILVSHRFPSVRKADHIVVLHQGRVVEGGTHDELVALAGRYERMYATQAAPFLRGGERYRAVQS